MPCIALGQKKIYRASPARKRDRKIRNTQPVSQTEKLKPETKELVKAAQTAVEVAVTAPVSQSKKSTKKSKSRSAHVKVKPSRKLAQKLNQFKTAVLRRSAVKAARTSSANKPEPAAKKSTPESTPAKTAAVRLKDGDHIQIRPHRARPTTKPARILKKNAKAQTKPKRRLRLYRPSRADLINAESRLGSTIFGPVPDGHRREFFHDRENIWIWHESWVDAERHPRQLTVRYEVRPSGVYKKLSAGKYFKLDGAELENFLKATRTYLALIKQHIYHAA